MNRHYLDNRVIIRGAGEMASGVIRRLFLAGFEVIALEQDSPDCIRRTVCYAEAISKGKIVIEGVTAKQAKSMAEINNIISQNTVPVMIDPEAKSLPLLKAFAVIDGRMLKTNLDNSIHDAPLVIGFGPGLVAGRDVHFVVETHRGHDLGRIISEGTAMPDTGIPGPIRNHTIDRVLRSPADGVFQTAMDIGDSVQAGDEIGTVGSHTISAVISGIVRGLLASGSAVTANQKIGDIDPRGIRSYCHTLSDKTRTLSGAALEIIVTFLKDR